MAFTANDVVPIQISVSLAAVIIAAFIAVVFAVVKFSHDVLGGKWKKNLSHLQKGMSETIERHDTRENL